MRQATERRLRRPVGRWCRVGAWISALVGVFQIVFFLWGRFVNSPYYFGTFGSASEFTSTLQYLLQIIATTLFFTLMLYTAGVIADSLLGGQPGSNEAQLASEETDEKASP